MNDAIQFLNEQIESDETWKPDHKRAMECADLGDTIRVGLALFSLINGYDELWSRRVQSGATPFSSGVAKAIYGMYEWWIKPCDYVFEAAHTMTEQQQDAAYDRLRAEGYRFQASGTVRARIVW